MVVVVDVHSGVAAAAVDEEGDEILERPLLTLAVACADRAVDEVAVLSVHEAEEIVEPVRRLVERVALEIEVDVALVGRRQELEAALVLEREELVRRLAGLTLVEL
jgi:imidazole glycerol phosphate synthase subunit HisF